MKNLFVSAAALSIAIAAPAQAAVIINPDNSVTFDNTGGANSVSIAFNGLGGTPKAVVPGLSATLNLTLSSIAGNTFNFGYSLQNTSTVAGTRVSGIGFDVTPNVSGVFSDGVFDNYQFDNTPGNFAASFKSETCFWGAGGNGQNCPESNGQPGNSVAFGSTGSGTLALTFAGPQTSITLSNFLDRYQGFSTSNVLGETRIESAVGVGTPIPPVPEPTTWALMLVGFGAIGAAMRRRQSANVAATLSLS